MNKKAFTLVEMIGVVAVMVILVTIALPNILKTTKVVERMHNESYENAILLASETYISQKGNDIGERVTELTPGETYMFKVKDLVDNGYVQSTLTDEINGHTVEEDENCVEVSVDTNGVRKYTFVEYKNNVCRSTMDEKSLKTIYPEFSLNVINVFSSSAKISATIDNKDVAIKKVEYSLDNGNSWIDNGVSNEIVATSLDHNTAYKIYVRVILINDNNKVESVDITTKELLAPTYYLSNSDWDSSKEVIIAYPSVEAESVKYQYSTDKGNTWKDTTDARTHLTFNKNGSVIARISDGTNTVTASTLTIDKIDTVAPIITAVDGNNNTSWVSSLTITVTATDSESGLHNLAYSFDNGATWQESNKYIVVTSGTYNIVVRDKAGNISETNLQTVEKVSSVTPTISIAKGNVGSNSIAVTATVDKIESGIKKIEYSSDNGATWTSGGTSKTHTFTGLTKNKAYNIKARVTANNGLSGTSSSLSVTTSNITAPTYKVNTTGWATSKTVTITYPTVANTTLTRQYSTNGGSSWTTSSANTQTVTFTANGNVIARVTDGTNTVTGSTYSVSNIDTQNPTATYAIASGTAGTNGWYKSNVGVKITPSAPGGSGVSSYKYCTTTGSSCTPSTAVSGSTATTVTLSTQSASNKICTAVTSGAGKSNTVCSGVYKIDKTAPTLTVNGHTSNFTVTSYSGEPTRSATDNLTSSPTITKSGSVNTSKSGTYNLTFTATDAAGNSKSVVMTVKLTISCTARFRVNWTGKHHGDGYNECDLFVNNVRYREAADCEGSYSFTANDSGCNVTIRTHYNGHDESTSGRPNMCDVYVNGTWIDEGNCEYLDYTRTVNK